MAIRTRRVTLPVLSMALRTDHHAGSLHRTRAEFIATPHCPSTQSAQEE
jgi:hypothetical protein